MIDGRVTGIEAGALVGWIAVADEQDAWLEATAEGEGQFGRSRAEPAIDGRRRFAIAIPDAFQDGRIRFLDARLLGETRALPGGPLIHSGGLFDLPEPMAPPARAAPSPPTGGVAVEGQVSFHPPSLLEGWAWAPEDPSRRLGLEIVAGGRFVAAITADQLRQDLAEEGLGDARYGFRVDLAKLLRRGPHDVCVRVAGAVEPLPGGAFRAGPFAADGEVDCPGYLDDHASRALMVTLPFEHLAHDARRIAPGRLAPRLINRLRRERLALDGREPPTALLLLLPGAGVPEARVWWLQSHPDGALAEAAEGAAAIRRIAADAGFVFFARQGDILHPSAGLIAADRDCDGLLWPRFSADEARAGAAGMVSRRPPFDAATARHGALTDTTLALRGSLLAEAPDAVLEAVAQDRMHPLWFWLAGRPAAWGLHPEALTSNVGPPPLLSRQEVETDTALCRGLLEAEGGRYTLESTAPDLPFPHVLVPTRRAGTTSVLVSFRNRAAMTLRCLDSLARQKLSGELEVVLVDNQSRPEEAEAVTQGALQMFGAERVVSLAWDRAFSHSGQNNLAARAARGDVILICNNDVVLQDPGAVEQLGAWALQSGVGTVGCRLLDPQRNLGSHGQEFARPSADPFQPPLRERPDPAWGRHVHTCAGATLALAAMARDRFEDLGGLDEARFPIGYNDIDLALRCRERGLTSLYLGHVSALHPRGSSRTGDNEDLQALRLNQRYPASARGWLEQLGCERIETARSEVQGDLPRSGPSDAAMPAPDGAEAAVQARREMEAERAGLARALVKASAQAESLAQALEALRSLGT